MEDTQQQKTFIQQMLSPIVNALKTVTGRSQRDIAVLKGEVPQTDKVYTGENVESKLSQIFTGYLDLQFDRFSMYRDYDNMDRNSTEIQTGLDIYAEEASQRDAKTGLKVWVSAEDEELAAQLNGMLQRIKMEQKAYGIYRSLAKYGDCFLYLILGAYGVHDTVWIHPQRVEIMYEGGVLGFKSTELSRLVPNDNKNNFFKPWDFLFIKRRAYDRETTYGRSLVEGLRKTWKQFAMLEQMIIIYRVTKAVQRNIFFVDVGQSAPQEVEELLKKYQKFVSNKKTFIDPKTNEFKLDFDPSTLLQDIIWPIRPGTNSRVDQIQNTGNIGPIVDLEHFANKMRIGLNIPKEYFDGDVSGNWNSREALMLQDARFGRKIAQLQDCMREGIIKLCQIHWAVAKQEYLPPEAFKVELGTVSDSADRMREDILLRKAQIMEILINVSVVGGWNRWVWSDYVLSEIFPLPDKLRAKLYTPDPVQDIAFDKEKELLQLGNSGQAAPGKTDKPGMKGKPGGAGVKGVTTAMKKILPNKPPKKVTADNLKQGLRGFGSKREEIDNPEVSRLLEEIDEFSELLTEIEGKKLNKQNNFGSVFEARVMGYSEDELADLIQESKDKLVETDLNKTNWKELRNLDQHLFSSPTELDEEFKSDK